MEMFVHEPEGLRGRRIEVGDLIGARFDNGIIGFYLVEKVGSVRAGRKACIPGYFVLKEQGLADFIGADMAVLLVKGGKGGKGDAD